MHKDGEKTNPLLSIFLEFSIFITLEACQLEL